MKLGDVASIIMGQAPPASSYNKQGIGVPFVKVAHFSTDYPEIVEWTDEPKKMAQEGDVLICVVGNVGVTNLGIDAAIGRSVAAIRPDKEKISQSFLRHFLKSKIFQLTHKGQGAIQKVLTSKVLSELNIPNIPIAEQTKIASILDKADEIKQNSESTTKIRSKLVMSLFFELFGDPITNPKSWQIVSVGTLLDDNYIIEIQDGNHGEIHPKVSDFVEIGIPFVAANALSGNRLNLDDCPRISSNQGKDLRVGFSKGRDVILTHKGTIGLSAVVPRNIDEIILTPQTTYYRLNEDHVLPEYLCEYFKTQYFQKILAKEAKQSTRAYVGITRQRKLPVMLPEIDLQKKFNHIINQVDRSMELIENFSQLSELNSLSLIQEMLT